jgi:hypothetical protein
MLSTVNNLKVNEEIKAGVSVSKIVEEYNVVKQTSSDNEIKKISGLLICIIAKSRIPFSHIIWSSKEWYCCHHCC